MSEPTDNPSPALADLAARQAARPVHAVKVGTSKWQSFGRAVCGCTISGRTPQTRDPEKVTCGRCLKRISRQTTKGA